jgi:hypothetical protein
MKNNEKNKIFQDFEEEKSTLSHCSEDENES